VHPASILRVRDPQSREAAFGEFVADIRVIKKVMG